MTGIVERLRERVGDETIAEALRIAERRLIKLGWSYGHDEVGKMAAQIIAGLDAPIAGKSARLRKDEGDHG